MSPNIQQAIVAAEDTRFYEHHGVDPKGVARAFVANQQAGGVSQGASTLTMQYVRMALRDSAQTPREVRRPPSRPPAQGPGDADGASAREGADQGPDPGALPQRRRTSATGAYGIFAAGADLLLQAPGDLTPAEAATLAGLVQVAVRVRPGAARTSRRATARRNYVLDQMAQLGYRPRRRRGRRRAQPIDLRPHRPAQRLRLGHRHAQRLGLLLRLLQELVERAARVRGQPGGADGQAAPRRLHGSSAELDPRIQAAAEKNVGAKEKHRQPVRPRRSWSSNRAPAGSRRWR